MSKTKTTDATDVVAPPAPEASSKMSLVEAAMNAERFGQYIRAFASLHETAQAILGFEQNRSERLVMLDRLAVEIKDAQATLAQVKTDCDLAKVEAKSILDEAKAKAEDVKSKTHTACQAEIDEAVEKVKAATEEANQLSSESARLKSAVAHSEEELKLVNERLEQARAKLREFLGA